TGLGDAVAGGDSHAPFGIPAVPVPLWDFTPEVVEHVTLTGTDVISLSNSNIVSGSEVVVPETLASTATTPFTEGAGNDYVIDYVNGTIQRDAAGSIGAGDVVKITYQAPPQILLTHMNN